MVQQLDHWLAQFSLAMTLVGRLIEELQPSLGGSAPAGARGEPGPTPLASRRPPHEAPPQPVRSATERRLSSHVSLLSLVSQRLALASSQVQHTRAQATALDSLHKQLATSELGYRRLAAAAATSSRSEPMAAAERQALVAEVRTLESAVTALALRLQGAAGQHTPRPEQQPTPSPAPDMSELIRLQEVAREEAYQRFEALRELEEARASAAAAHSRRPQTAAASLGLHRRSAADPSRRQRGSPQWEIGEDRLDAAGCGSHRAERGVGAVWPRVQPRDFGGVALTSSPWGLVAQAGDGVQPVPTRALETEALPLRPARAAPRRLWVAEGGEPARWV